MSRATILIYLAFAPVIAFAQENTSLYGGITAAVGDYAGSEQVRGAAAYGVLLGRQISSQWSVELSFIQSQYEVQTSRCPTDQCSGANDPAELNLTQKTITLSSKRLFGAATVRPFAGAGLGYTIREYDSRRKYYFSGRELPSPESSQNFVLNVNLGAEVQLSQTFLLSSNVGANFPLTKQKSGSADHISGNLYDVNRPVEELNNYLFSLSGIFVF